MSKPTKDSSHETPAPASARAEIDAFLEQVHALGLAAAADKRGRLIFALDATMSRQPTWDSACALQAEMFREAARSGGLDIQLVYFRGLSECCSSGWVANGERLAELMSRTYFESGKMRSYTIRNEAMLAEDGEQDWKSTD